MVFRLGCEFAGGKLVLAPACTCSLRESEKQSVMNGGMQEIPEYLFLFHRVIYLEVVSVHHLLKYYRRIWYVWPKNIPVP